MTFAVGDRVCVLFQQFPIVFTINQITTDGHGKPLYMGDKSEGWWPEDKLDYHMEDELKEDMTKLDNLIYTITRARKELGEFYSGLLLERLPKALRRKYDKLIAQAMDWY